MIGANNSKPVVVVPVVGVVVVALVTTQIVGIVVPGAAAQRTDASVTCFSPQRKLPVSSKVPFSGEECNCFIQPPSILPSSAIRALAYS